MGTSEHFVQGKEEGGVKLAIYLHLLSRLRKCVFTLLLPHPLPSFSYVLTLSTKISLSNQSRQIARPCEAGIITVISDSSRPRCVSCTLFLWDTRYSYSESLEEPGL